MLVGNQQIQAARQFCIITRTMHGYNLCCKYHCCTHGHNKGFGKIFTPLFGLRKLNSETSNISAGGSRRKFFFYSFENTKFFQFFLQHTKLTWTMYGHNSCYKYYCYTHGQPHLVTFTPALARKKY